MTAYIPCFLLFIYTNFLYQFFIPIFYTNFFPKNKNMDVRKNWSKKKIFWCKKWENSGVKIEKFDVKNRTIVV